MFRRQDRNRWHKPVREYPSFGTVHTVHEILSRAVANAVCCYCLPAREKRAPARARELSGATFSRAFLQALGVYAKGAEKYRSAPLTK